MVISLKNTLEAVTKVSGALACRRQTFRPPEPFIHSVKKTLVLGATPNPNRYAYLAIKALRHHGHEVVPVGIRTGEVDGLPILTNLPPVEGVDTVTLYIGPERQPAYYDYLLSLKPRRLIFNPGTENPELEALAKAHGIEPVEGCTLIMLRIGVY